MLNSELLKEAIADAKAIRATALANAKAALEENFRPRFEAVFAEKLKEDTEEEDVEEVSAPNQVQASDGEARGPKTKDVSKGEPVVVSDEESVTKESAEDDEESQELEEAELTSEDLDEIIRELEMEVAEEEEGKPVEVNDSDKESSAEIPEKAPEETPEEDPEEDPEKSSEETPEIKDDESEKKDSEVKDDAEKTEDSSEESKEGSDDQEEINLDELLKALNEEVGEEEEEEEEGEEQNENVEECDSSTTPVEVKKTNTFGNIGKKSSDDSVVKEENVRLKAELNECIKTIEFLRGQINEVNLLNAKLLYANKLFKEFADVLDDAYRMKIIESFDLTKSVREVKLAYALLAESLSFGKQVAASKKNVSKTSTRAGVKQITEGLASAPVASTKPSATIITEEVSDMATRFKKLAGIRSPSKS